MEAIGIIGAGRLGMALAQLCVKADYETWLANSRGPATLRDIVGALGPLTHAATVGELAGRCDAIVLAVRWQQIPALRSGLPWWKGKIIVDATNNRYGPTPSEVFDLGGRGSSEIVAVQFAGGARIVKAFNHQSASALHAFADGASSRPKAFFVAGDDAEAKACVCRCIRRMGGVPVDTGSLVEGGRLQNTGGPLAGFGELLDAPDAIALLRDLRRRSD